jgi:hypothetical protein
MYLHQNYLLHHSSLSSLPSFLEQFQHLIHFHTWVYGISTIFTLLYPFPLSYPLLLVPTPRQDPFHPTVLHFWEKGISVCLQGISLWHFHVYMYYILSWFIVLHFSLLFLSPTLMVILASLNVLYSEFSLNKYFSIINILGFPGT